MYFLLTVIIISWFEHPPQLPQFPLQEPPPQPPCLCSRMMLLTQSTTTRSKIIPTITFPIASSYIRITEQLLIRTQGIYPAVYCTTRDFLHTALCIRFKKTRICGCTTRSFLHTPLCIRKANTRACKQARQLSLIYSLQRIYFAASASAAIRLSARTHICIWNYLAASTLVSVCTLSSGW